MYFKKMSDKQTAKEKQNGVLDYIAVPGKGGQNRIIDITRYPVMNKQTESRISKDYADTNSVMNTISDAMKTKKQLDAITKENAFSAVGSTAGSYPSKVKEKWANVQNAFGIDNNASKNLNKEVRLRNLLKTQLEILQVTAERSKSGKAPTDMLMKRFIDKKVLPSVDDVSEDIDNKLKWMNSELKRKSNIDEISLKSKRQIYDELPQEMEEAEETASPAQENEEHPQESASNLATAATLREMFPDFADKDKYPDEKLIRWAKTPEAQKLINGE
jgi:hypothetical protein